MPRTDGVLLGVVNDSTGPLSGAKVALYDRTTDNLVLSTTTNGSGQYLFSGLDPTDTQRFFIVARHPSATDINAQVLDRMTPVAATTVIVDAPSLGDSAICGNAMLEIVIGAQTAAPAGFAAPTPAGSIVHRGDILWDEVTMLYNFDEATSSNWFAQAEEHSNVPLTLASGNVYLSTDQKKFGTSSALFDGWMTYVQDPYNSASPTGYGHAFNFHTYDYTIEAWLRPLLGAGAPRTLIGKFSSWPNGIDFVFEIEGGAGKAAVWFGASQTAYHELAGFTDRPNGEFAKTQVGIMSDAALPLNVWSHVAVCRKNGVTTMYIDGTPQSTTVTETAPTFEQVFLNTGDAVYGSTYSGPPGMFTRITYPVGTVFIKRCVENLPLGASPGAVNPYRGYVNGLRTTAVARYDGAFTPQATAYRGW